MTLITSSGPISASVTCSAPVPKPRDRQLARGEGHLVARDADRLEDRPTEFPFGVLVEAAEAVADGCGGSVRSHRSAPALFRAARKRSRSDWNVT
jgi:hypothetical protein